MSPSRIIVGLLFLLALVAGMAWALLDFEDGDLSPSQHGCEALASTDSDDVELPAYGSSGESDSASNDGAADADIHIPVPDIDATSDPDATGRDSGSTRQSPTGQPTSRQPKTAPPKTQPKSTPKTTPKPKRRLSHAEREEARRVKTGRPALKRRLSSTPASTLTGTKAKTPAQQEWEDSFVADGIEPPEMIPTKVTGKIMSEQSREGLKDATVGLMTFFPINGLAGGSLYPVMTTLTTDDNGMFSGEIPGSKLAPSNYAALAVTITWEGHAVLAGEPASLFEVGKDNSLGIIWAPDVPYQVRCNADAFSGERKVVATGQLDPQRWHPQKRAEAFGWFPHYEPLVVLADSGPIPQGMPQAGECDVVGTWNRQNLPYVSLLVEGQLLQTRRTTRAKTMSNVSG
ncbi:MAG: hypothetical protein ACYTDT_10280, partial [Planctomycetota bacterium]